MNSNQNKDIAGLPPTDTIGLAEILRLLNRRKYLILATILICVVASAIYTSHLPSKYEAICTLDIDLNTPKTIFTPDQGANASEEKMATQLGILTSQSIAWDVISKLRLDQNADFMGGSVTNKQDLASMPDVYRFALIRRFRGGLGAQYARGTEIAEIRYRSLSPALSAQIANAIADAYIQRSFEAKFNTTHNTSEWLSKQLQALRTQVAEAEQEFADFQRKTGILVTDESHSTILDSVAQLNTALSVAQTQRILKEISYRESMTGTEPDQVLSPQLLPMLQTMRTQKATLEAEYASLTPKYGDAYPRVVQLKSQIAQVQATIDAQIARGREQLQLEYKAALADEQKLNAALETRKQEIFAMNENVLRYSLLQRQVIARRELYEGLNRKLQEAEITSGLNSDAISIIDKALSPNVPAEPRRTLNLEAGFLIGLILGVALAFIVENVNTSVRSVEDVTLYSGLPLLGLVPHASESAGDANSRSTQNTSNVFGPRVTSDGRSHFAEAFRSLRSSLLLSLAGGPPQLIVICSAWPKEGKSTISINLATVLAQTGKKVLLVDADLRRPSLHLRPGMASQSIGLSGLLTTQKHLDSSTYVHSTLDTPTLHFLPAGPIPPSSAELLLSAKMAELITEWRQLYDFIVVDTAPVLAISDTAALAALADAIVMVVRAGKTRRQSLRALRDVVVGVKGRIAGVLLNDVKTSSEAYYDYYGGKGDYGTYYSEDTDA